MMTRSEWLKISVVGGGLTACTRPERVNPPGNNISDSSLSSESILARSTVIDLHCDTPIRLVEENFDLSKLHESGELDIPRMRQGGINAVFFSVYTAANDKTALESVKQALKIIDAIVEEVYRHPNDLVLAVSPNEILDAKKTGKIAILMGVEGGHMIDSSLAVLRNFYRLGARYLTLTHSASTGWADSSGGMEGLTDFGKDVVREMNQLGMMIDISHVSDSTFFDAIQASKAPIIASHSSCRALASHPRNMTDEMLQSLAQNGGVIHINYYNVFLDDDYNDRSRKHARQRTKNLLDRGEFKTSQQLAMEKHHINQENVRRIGRVPLSRLIDHFEHAVKVAGIDHVGMGSDFDGVRSQLPKDMEDISKIPNLVVGLSERGFSDTDITKILGGNTLRVMRDVQALAAKSNQETQRLDV